MSNLSCRFGKLGMLGLAATTSRAVVARPYGGSTYLRGLVVEETLLIPLRNRAGIVVAEAIIDASDGEAVNRWAWCLNANGYAWRNSVADPAQAAHAYLHRWLAGATPGDGLYVDHINRNRMDNRRSNLRLVTPAQAAQNKPALSGRYRGVAFDRSRGKWVAQGQVGGMHHFIGRFATENEAGAAARAWRLEHMPFAVEDVV